MLSKLDDYPIHQTPEPIAHTAASDRFTYDRYWYNGHDGAGEYYFGVALCRYPNLGILDCSLTVVAGGRQHAFHASGRAPAEPTDTRMGPFTLQILEPMGRHRITIDDNDTGIACDLVFTPRTAAIQEGRQTTRNTRHVVMDATRMDQFGRWQGSIRFGGEELTLNSADTYGLKDRSWGIRPVGAPYTGAAPLDNHRALHFLWAPIHWRDHCSLAGCFEDTDGYQWHTDQAIVPAYDLPNALPGTIDPAMQTWRGTVGHQLTFEPGTRRASAAQILMRDHGGEQREITLEPLLLNRMKGLGYQHPEWGHGKWHGELAIGGESWACDDVDPLALENLHIQQVVRARCGDEVGYGVLEQFHLGPYRPYGFGGWFDGFGK